MPVIESPYHSPRGDHVPYLFFVHWTGGPHPEFTDAEEYAATIRWFQDNPLEVSAHWVVNEEGEITPMAALDRAAHQAGAHNRYSFGMELTNPGGLRAYTEGHYQGAALCFHLANNWLRANGYPQIKAQRVKTAFGDSGVIAHSDSEQGRSIGKRDPGELFNWERFLALIT